MTGLDSSASNKSDPIIQVINNCGKGLFIYNNSTRLAEFSSISTDYVLNAGKSGYFTGFIGGTNLSALTVDSTAWTKGPYKCDAKNEENDVSMENGKVYVVEITGTDSNTSKEPPKFELKEIKDLASLQ